MQEVRIVAARREGEQRTATRTNLYLSAVLRWRGHEGVVRIRNLSDHGAMVEGAVLPSAGAAIELMRGSLRATGTAAWTHGGRGGLALTDHLCVKDWLAPPGNQHQRQVDGMVAAVRRGERPDEWPRPQTPVERPDHDLRLLKALLEELAEELAADPLVIAAHAERLQSLDLADQLLGAMIAGDGPSSGSRLHDIRRAVSIAVRG
jgi:hypothetical protein